jgi:RNA polymerase sigma-70 factor (ECF subfamily)
MFCGTVAQRQAVLVNGLPGYVSWREDATPLSIISFMVADGRIAVIAIVADPASSACRRTPDGWRALLRHETWVC